MLHRINFRSTKIFLTRAYSKRLRRHSESRYKPEIGRVASFISAFHLITFIATIIIMITFPGFWNTSLVCALELVCRTAWKICRRKNDNKKILESLRWLELWSGLELGARIKVVFGIRIVFKGIWQRISFLAYR